MKPPEEQRYVGCPDCGYVTTVYSDGSDEDRPFCIHANGTYVWRDRGEGEYAQMVFVTVTEEDT